jgi:RNase H-fold protein (predicted Holliday junction resolvase)
MILAIDPGKDKCGVAVLDLLGDVHEKRIIPSREILALIPILIKKHGISTLVIGKGGPGKRLAAELAAHNPVLFPEKNSTLEARRRYWEENKPAGLWRLVPTSLRTPPVPVDDLAAVILGKRYLKG